MVEKWCAFRQLKGEINRYLSWETIMGLLITLCFIFNLKVLWGEGKGGMVFSTNNTVAGTQAYTKVFVASVKSRVLRERFLLAPQGGGRGLPGGWRSVQCIFVFAFYLSIMVRCVFIKICKENDS